MNTPLISHTALWITWEKQVRNRTLSTRLNAELLEICEPGSRLTRYIRSTRKTVQALRRWRGKTVIAQNPSVILATLILLLKPFIRYRAVIDAHNAGVSPDHNNILVKILIGFVIRYADVTIVTNKRLAEIVHEKGGNPVVLPDPLPKLRHAVTDPIHANNDVLFICTWAPDEPYLEVLRAAEIAPNIRMLITGSSKGRELAYGKSLPSNVKLLGYVPDDEYHRLLFSCSVIIDLTTRENCLVCGAYEAIAAATPFILSDSAALKEYFSRGGVHVANNAESIANGIKQILGDQEKYKTEIKLFRDTLEASWIQQCEATKPALFG